MCVIRKGNKEKRGASLPFLFRECTLWIDIRIYVGWSFNSGTDFFLSEWVELPASWLSPLQNSDLVIVCTYSSVLPLTKANLVVTFCNSPLLSRRVGLNIFNVIESANFHCFLQLWEQEDVTRSKVRGVGRLWERWNVIFRQKFICDESPVGRALSWCGVQLPERHFSGRCLRTASRRCCRTVF